MAKNIFYLLVLLFMTKASFGQAPNFTATDINNNSHTLNTYLNQGKVVVIDFFTTWCGPCKSLHNTHILDSLYNHYGPNGTDQLMVMAIECDSTTTGADLSAPFDWVTGVPYPIIDLADESIVDLYFAYAYPTIMVVCPNGDSYGYPKFTQSKFASEPRLNYANLNSVNDIKKVIEDKCGTTFHPLSVNNLEASDILSVRTSPSGMLEIQMQKMDGKQQELNLNIYDISGKKLITKRFNIQDTYAQIDMSRYANNIYFYKFEYDGMEYSNKFSLYK